MLHAGRSEVCHVFMTDGQRIKPGTMPDCSLSSSVSRLWVVGRMCDCAFAVTEIRGDREQLYMIDKPPRRCLSPCNDEADYAAEIFLLLSRQFVLRVIGQPREVDLLYSIPGAQPGGDLCGIPAVSLHPQAQGFESFQKYPGIKRTHCRTAILEDVEHVLPQQFFAAQHGAADAASLTVPGTLWPSV